MAGHLLLVVLMYSFSEMKAKALLPPKLTVNPAVITQTETVTLNCQTPSHLNLSECYFRMVRGQTGKSLPCLQTLTGTELLKMADQSSPAEVQVTCFYLHVSQSPDSDPSSIIIRTLLPSKLTVNPAAINETDSVTLNCQTPSSVSVSLCYFFTLSGGSVRGLSCLQNLTGTELLNMAHQSSPAEVQVTCFYTVKVGEKSYPSPHSDTSSITIHRRTVGTSSNTDSFISTFPPSVKPAAETDTSMTPESGDEITGRTVGTSSNTDSFISTFPTPVKPAAVTSMIPMTPESGDEITGRTAGTSSNTDSFISTFPTPVKPAAETWIWKCVAVVAGCGVMVGVILLVSAILCNKRRTGSEKVRRQEPQNENFDTYHMYSIIAEDPAASGLKDMVYSTVQPH
ncbi:hypothetical protein PFLUV_G00050810 [Perca fluviatilis]|uniref:Uncharacterized protein n=1 Tax=Perca fluviatilis TaxID=8168 RepID=A0A6A5ES12_PERFL|nr:uncharacterized protein LOC120557027 isoform X1 [Perca fluviatilis]KAF1392247.1 hypothetical protein PFLUV_G00050810 [Perca fluviatilis]